MINTIRCILILSVIYMPAFVLYGITYLPKLARHQFAVIMSATVGVELFLLAVMVVQSRAILVGLVLFLLAFPGIYPFSSLLYPRYEARVEKRLTKDRKND